MRYDGPFVTENLTRSHIPSPPLINTKPDPAAMQDHNSTAEFPILINADHHSHFHTTPASQEYLTQETLAKVPVNITYHLHFLL